MKLIKNIVLITSLGLSVAACGGGESDPKENENTPQIEPIGFEARIGIIPANAN